MRFLFAHKSKMHVMQPPSTHPLTRTELCTPISNRDIILTPQGHFPTPLEARPHRTLVLTVSDGSYLPTAVFKLTILFLCLNVFLYSFPIDISYHRHVISFSSPNACLPISSDIPGACQTASECFSHIVSPKSIQVHNSLIFLNSCL